jgi:hypothetical protein
MGKSVTKIQTSIENVSTSNSDYPVNSVRTNSEKTFRHEHLTATANLKVNYDQDLFQGHNGLVDFLNHSIANQRPYVQCCFHNVVTTDDLIDLGSCTNYINILALQDLEQKLGHVLPRVTTNVFLKSFGGNVIGKRNVVFLKISTSKMIFYAPFVIVDAAMKSEFVFGAAILLKHRMILDNYENKQLYLGQARSNDEIGKIHLKGLAHPLAKADLNSQSGYLAAARTITKSKFDDQLENDAHLVNARISSDEM